MTNSLENIAKRKHLEVLKLKGKYTVEEGVKKTAFSDALKKRGVIGEIAGSVPTKGIVAESSPPASLAKMYEEAGVIALSCQTDASLGGATADLIAVSKKTNLPILRKDFLIDPLQIMEAIHLGASAVLLSVQLLKEKTKMMLEATETIGLEAVVEVHDQEELAYALSLGASIIEINNQNLATDEVDPSRAFKLFQHIPSHIHAIIETGRTAPQTAHFYFDHGVSACVITDAFTSRVSCKEFIQKTRKPYVKICGVRSKEVAQLAAEYGADFIGVVCDESSSRYVSPASMKNVVRAIKEGGVEPVCVFTNHSSSQMKEVCAFCGVSTVQLNGKESIQNHSQLPDDFIRIFVQPVQADGTYKPLRFEGINVHRDYILYEFTYPRSNESFDFTHFTPIPSIPFFVGGGLRPQNVSHAKQSIHANGYDVCSGVENARGNKDAFLIHNFIQKTKE